MVLRIVAAGVLALVVGAAPGCIQRTEPARLEQRTPVAVAIVQDPEGGGQAQDVPNGLKDAVTAELAKRNLTPEWVPYTAVAEPFSRLRSTERRFGWLKEATQAPLVLLVETKTSFFSQISGRYRWVVYGRLTGDVRKPEALGTTRDVEQAVTLVYDHERGPEALVQAAPRLAESAGTLFDDILPTAPAVEPVAPVSPPAQEQQLQREPAAPPNQTVPQPAEPAPAPEPTGMTLPAKGAIYFVMVDRFANGDRSNDGEVDVSDPAAFHGGDLQGLIDRLDDLKGLGVEAVWLSPVFQMRTEKFFGHGAFHGYWVEDPGEVEPRFGDRRLLRRLSDELHRRGMKLVLDVVLNHVGPGTKLARTKPEWFHREGPLEDWNDPEQLVRRDVHGLPDLAQDRPDVYAWLLENSVKWIREVRPDGFRLDAVKHMPVAFWRRYLADIRKAAGPDFLLLGEMLEGDPRELARTAREGGFDAVFDFPLHFAVVDVFCKDAPATRLGTILSLDRLYEAPHTLVTLPDNHDLPRLASSCGGDLARIEQALTVTLLMRGTPSLTWGTEAGLTGEKEPENRGDMRFGPHPLRAHISRLLALRQAHPALHTGTPSLVAADREHLVVHRYADDDAAIVAINRGKAPLTLAPPEGSRVDDFVDAAASQTPVSALTVPPRSTRVFVSKARKPGVFAGIRQKAEQAWRGAPSQAAEVLVQVQPPKRKGGVIKVVGSAPELGAWDVTRAPAVPASGQVAVALPPGVYEYKLVLERPGQPATWEDGQNRVLFVRGSRPSQTAPLTFGANP